MLDAEFLGWKSDDLKLDEESGIHFANICEIFALLNFSLLTHKLVEVCNSKDCMCIF